MSVDININAFSVEESTLPLDFDLLKKRLNEHKNTLSEIEPKRFKNIRNALDHFREYKRYLSDYIQTPNPSNAWLKMYEILSRYRIAEELLSTSRYNVDGMKSINTFHNAEFPGSFILATAHYLGTRMNTYGGNTRGSTTGGACGMWKWRWLASSMIGDNNLDDKYDLYKNYKNNWVMDEDDTPNKEARGDITRVEYVLQLKEMMQREVDLYTSDLGFEVADFNTQEVAHARANLGQILAALLTLRTGGVMLTKQYTIFEPFTISLLSVVSQFFSEFHIIKPLTSRALNSECYILGKGFLASKFTQEVETKLLSKLQNFNTEPLACDVLTRTYAHIYEASRILTENQIAKIETCMKYHYKYENITDNQQLFSLVYSNDKIERVFSQKKFDEIVKFKKLDTTSNFNMRVKKLF